MPKHAYDTTYGVATCDTTHYPANPTDPGTIYAWSDDPSRRNGYTEAGVARRDAPAHRANGFWTYDRTGTLAFYAAYDQT